MIRKKNQEKYKEFHRGTLPQTKIIREQNFTYRIVLGVINKFLSGSPKNILDIGCGAGTVALYLASKGHNVIGIDIARSAIDACNESARLLRLNNVSFKVMDFPREVPKQSFDFILCSEVLEHLSDDNLALKKIFRLLNPGGIAVISTPSKNAPLYRFGLAKEFDDRVGHLRRYTLGELTQKCKKIGFTVLETKKTEGILRNFLFLNPVAGKFIRFIKFFLSDFVTFIDGISLRLFAESQIFIVVQK